MKEEAGKALHKPGMVASGKMEKIADKAENKVGEVQRKMKNKKLFFIGRGGFHSRQAFFYIPDFY